MSMRVRDPGRPEGVPGVWRRLGDKVVAESACGEQRRLNMSMVHAWFSQMAALRLGSTVYRKASGSMVNVTRTGEVKEAEGLYKLDEKYLGEVIAEKDGGAVGTRVRVGGITR